MYIRKEKGSGCVIRRRLVKRNLVIVGIGLLIFSIAAFKETPQESERFVWACGYKVSTDYPHWRSMVEGMRKDCGIYAPTHSTPE